MRGLPDPWQRRDLGSLCPSTVVVLALTVNWTAAVNPEVKSGVLEEDRKRVAPLPPVYHHNQDEVEHESSIV